MKARDVLHDFWDQSSPDDDCEDEVAFLLDVTPAGEGVYIAPDGTLMRTVEYWPADPGRKLKLYRLVPVSPSVDPEEGT